MRLSNQRSWAEATIELPDHDCDLNIKLPDGRELLLQRRTEHDTIDICLGRDSEPLTQMVYVTDADGRYMPKNTGQQITIC